MKIYSLLKKKYKTINKNALFIKVFVVDGGSQINGEGGKRV